jgi:hypothetical protein
MRHLVPAVLAAAALAAGCGCTTPVSFCDNFEVEICARVYQCWDDATKAGTDFQSHYGTTEAQCDSLLKAKNCASVTNDKPCAIAGTTYHPDKADACVADLKATSCDVVKGVNGAMFQSANCDAVCS